MVERRVFGLDVLRALAIFTVVYSHGEILKGNSFFLNQLYKFSILIDGVTIFFVLSGFLIGHILLRIVANGFFDVRALVGFWIRRWFRTLPNYFMVLMWIVILNYNSLDKETILQFIFFVQNLFYPHPNIFLEAWSLSVEEWFYLSTPLLLFFLMKIKRLKHKKIILFWISIVILFSTLFRAYQASHITNFDYYWWDVNIRKEVFPRLDSLMYGILGAYLNRYHERAWTIWANKCFVIGVIMILWGLPGIITAVPQEVFYNYILLALTPISVLLLLPKLSAWNASPSPIKSIIVFISKISYSMYLIHFSLILINFIPGIMEWIYPSHFGNHEDLAKYFLYWGLTISISAMFYRYYEYPMTSLRDKIDFRKVSFQTRSGEVNVRRHGVL